MIQLTRKDGSTIYININHITAMVPHDVGSQIYFISGSFQIVQEKVNVIAERIRNETDR